MASAGLLVFWAGTLRVLNNLRSQNIKITEKIISVESRVNDIKNLEILFNSVKEGREEISQNIIAGKDELVKFIENIEFLAVNVGTKMEIKSVGIPENQADLSPIFNIELRGNFSDIFHFIEMLENLPYFISFKNVAIQRNLSQKEYKWEAKMNFTVLSYLSR